MDEKVRDQARTLGFSARLEKGTIEWCEYDRLAGVSVATQESSFVGRVEWEGPSRDLQTWLWSMAHHEWVAVNGRPVLRRDLELAVVVAMAGEKDGILRINSPDGGPACVDKHNLSVAGPSTQFLIEFAGEDPPAKIPAQFPATYHHLKRRFAAGAPVPVLYFSADGFGPRSVRFGVTVYRLPDPYVEIRLEGLEFGCCVVSPELAKEIARLVMAGADQADSALMFFQLTKGQDGGNRDS
jgi:hypothetical protein